MSKTPSAARDIRRTLAIKCVLLSLLWFFCLRGTERISVDGPTWLLGPTSSTSTSVQHNQPNKEVIS
ncbi:MAG: hypothetical protein P1U39_02795 [Legionellaceae bacterium]|nr:hypothetical protein [Legionellaceae bacterium]